MGKMQKLISILAIAAMAITSLPVASADAFSDVPPTNEFYAKIEDLAARNVVSGLNGKYYPENGVTRAELTKMALGAFGITNAIPEGAPHFTDVPSTHSLFAYVETAYGLGIVSGYGDGTFRPDQQILRQEGMKIVMFVARSVDTEGNFDTDLTGAPHFDDVSATSEFYEQIETAYNLGIISGYGNGKFGPRDTMRRDQMAKVISNAIYVFEYGKPTSPVGRPDHIVLETSQDEIYPDGYSTATITATLVDINGNRIGDYEEPVTFTTDLGTFEDTEDDTFTTTSDGGRAQATLVSAREEGTATVTADTGSFDQEEVEVEFTRDAPVTRNGFGSSSVSGVGEIQIQIVDDKILTDLKTTDHRTVFEEMCGGMAQIQVFVQDDEGDPVQNDEVKLTITEGTGALYKAIPTNCTPASTAVRSITISGATSTSVDAQSNNGRYFAWYKVLADQAEDTITIEAINLDTSPTLNVDAQLEVVNETLEATVYHDDIMARNNAQVTAGTAKIQNTATIYYLILDENGDPIETPHELETRFTAGPTNGARLVGETLTDVGTSDFDVIATSVNATLVEDRDGTDISGLYAVGVLAGSAVGTLTVQTRDVTAIGQPYVESTVSVHDPVIECYASSREVPELWDSSILCRMTDEDGMAVTGETLRLDIVGGDGSVDTDFINDAATTNVNMLELKENGTTGDPTGWYYAEYEAEDSVDGDETISLLAKATNRASLPNDELTVVATDDNPSGVVDLEIVALRNNIGPSTDVAVLAFTRDKDGVGISKLCRADTGSGASVETGFNGVLRINPSTLDNMTVTTGVTELGAEVSSMDCPTDSDWGYGNGAYWSVVRSKNVDDAGMVEYELYNSSAVLEEDVEEPYNIIDNSITTSSTVDEILVDEHFGVIVEVWDESNSDPVAALTDTDSSGFTVSQTGATVDVGTLNYEIIEVGCEATGGAATCNNNIDGTGLYVLSADSAPDVTAGDSVEITVTYTGAPTDPEDSVEVSIHDIELELVALPTTVSTTNAIAITAIMRDNDGDPIYVIGDTADVEANGVELEISDGSGEICNDNRADGCATGFQKIDMVALDLDPDGADSDGWSVFYLATYEAEVIEESVELTARVQGLNSRAEDTVTLDIA